MRLSKAGFSFIELLLVVSLIPILSLAVFGSLSAGFRIWKAMNQASPIEDLGIFYEKSERDFLNVSKFTGYPFEGGDGKVSFMTLIETDEALGGSRSIGQVTYSYDASQKAIVREQKNLNNLYEEKAGQKSVVLRPVRTFKPFFLTYEKLDERYVWKDSWADPEGKKIPVAVRFEFELMNAPGTGPLTKTYKIPVGGE